MDASDDDEAPLIDILFLYTLRSNHMIRRDFNKDMAVVFDIATLPSQLAETVVDLCNDLPGEELYDAVRTKVAELLERPKEASKD